MKIASRTLAGVITLVIANGASAAIVGPAAGYNVFIFGDGSFMSTSTDTMGNLAAGGNVILMNYAVAQGITGNPALSPNPAQLVVGGKLTAQDGGVGSNQAGAIYYGTQAPSLTSFTATGGQFANQSLVNFATSQALYTSLSTQLGDLANTKGATTTFNSNSDQLNFSGTNTVLNVFTVSDTDLSASKGIGISAPKGSTVLINVTGGVGGTATFSNGSVAETGVTNAAVLYNFVSDTTVDLAGSKDPEGSILAPLAGVVGGSGVMDGQLIAASYNGNTQFENVPFTGTVPLPGTLVLFSSGLLCLLPFGSALTAATRRRRICKPGDWSDSVAISA
jgi:choice-of-anchor A domain-containing protein